MNGVSAFRLGLKHFEYKGSQKKPFEDTQKSSNNTIAGIQNKCQASEQTCCTHVKEKTCLQRYPEGEDIDQPGNLFSIKANFSLILWTVKF